MWRQNKENEDMSTTPITLRAPVAWAIVDRAWRDGSHHCLRCDHRGQEVDHTPYQDGTAALATEYCRLLDNGVGTEYLKCAALLAHAEDEAEEAAVAEPPEPVVLYPRPRDLLDNPAPIIIGSAHVPVSNERLSTSAMLLQSRLLEPPKGLLSQLIATLFGRRWA